MLLNQHKSPDDVRPLAGVSGFLCVEKITIVMRSTEADERDVRYLYQSQGSWALGEQKVPSKNFKATRER